MPILDFTKLTRCSFLFAVLMFISSLAISQEICNNGIDDNNNGLTDLNDTMSCSCNSQASQVLSLFPNPSFEDFILCPYSFSQIQLLNGNWANGTDGTADYLNTCNYLLNAETAGLMPFPDGEGAVGGFYSNLYKEYVGTCLNAPLLANKAYILRFNVASSLVSFVPNQVCDILQTGLLEPVNVTLFGAPSCTNLPSFTTLCPTVGDPSWQVIGEVIYTPTQSWSEVQMTFTPAIDISAVMIGAPCTLPQSFPDSSSTECLPYFYYDNLVLNDSIAFEGSDGTVSGNICSLQPEILAEFTEPDLESGTYQWFQNGIAILGATDSIYTVPAGEIGFGNYQATLTNGNNCGISESFTVNSIPPIAGFSGAGDSLVIVGQTLELASTSNNANDLIWKWCADSVLSETVINLQLSDTGLCCIKLVAIAGECADTTEKCVTVIQFDEPEIPNVFSPNQDLLNDVFEIKENGVKVLSCLIYNRWGVLIHKWENDANGFWDGDIQGNPASEGTYFYVVNYKNIANQSKTENGFLTLLRD